MNRTQQFLFTIFLACALSQTSLWATPLTNAVENNDLIMAAQLLKQGANVNEKDPLGYTPLMIAAGFGNVQMVELLLTAGADVFILDSRMGASALHKASQSGIVDVARLIIQRGAFIDLQAPTLGHTPLIDAVWHKKTDMVRYLLSEGANMDLQTRYGAKAIDLAKRDNLTEIIRLLEERREYIAKRIEAHKLMTAVRKNDLESVKKLILEGADVNEKSIEDGHTPLLIASREGYTEIVRELLKAGASPRIVDGYIKATPGHKAGYMGHPEIAKLLTENGLEIDAQGPYNGYTALHDAIWHGHTETAKVYIEAGARLNLKGHDGRTPLDVAITDGYKDIVKLILDRMNNKNPMNANDVKSFLYQWFSWFDNQVEDERFLSHLSKTDLEIQFPEATLHNHKDFVNWYHGIKKTIKSNTHEPSDIKVTKNEQGGFDVEFSIRWQANTYDGKSLDWKVKQNWRLSVSPERKFIIERYVVKVVN